MSMVCTPRSPCAQSLETLSEEEREKFRKLALNIFVRHAPRGKRPSWI